MARRRENFGLRNAAKLNPLELPICDINTRGRLRPLDPSALERIKLSIQTIGLQSPITVRIDEEGGYHLIAGLHRLKAAESLGWHFIDSIPVEWDELRARKWEIAENLHRADLTELQRSEQLAEWMRITEEEQSRNNDISVQLAPKPPGGRPEGGERAAAREIGVDRYKARRAKKIDKIAPAAKEAVIEAGLANNQTALLEIAKHADEPAEAQVSKVHELAEFRAKKKPADDDRSHAIKEAEASGRRRRAMLDAWDAADNLDRAWFLSRIGASFTEDSACIVD